MPPPRHRWSSFHAVYGGVRDCLLLEVVRPLALELLGEGRVDGFFFIRYALGGPHVRIRFRHRPERAGAVARRLRTAAGEFFRAHPSAPWPEERVRRLNREILAVDPWGQDRVEANDTVREAEFDVEAEAERYGGLDRLQASLYYFEASSLEVLRLLELHRHALPDRRLGLGLLALARQALGFAVNTDDLVATIAATLAYWRQEGSVLVDRGDAMYVRGRLGYRRLLGLEVAGMLTAAEGGAGEAEADGPPCLAEAARRLRSELGPVPPPERRRILVSQMHMTANRLGLNPAEECYLARILERTARDLERDEPALWARLDAALRSRAGARIAPFDDLLRRSLAAAPSL